MFNAGTQCRDLLAEKEILVIQSGCALTLRLGKPDAIQIYAKLNDITQVFEATQRGDPTAATQLLPLLYTELRKLAAAKMARELPGQTLQPTALVHEAWLRLSGPGQPDFQSRAHFFGAAAEAMRRILIDNARRKAALRHGGGQARVDIEETNIAAPVGDDQLLAVHEALDKLAAEDAQKAELVKLRFFVGLSVEEAAEVLGVSTPTVKRWWAYAKAWLYQEIANQAGNQNSRPV